MLTKRLLAGVLSAGLLSVTPLAVSAPANAAGQTYQSVVQWDIHRMSAPYSGKFSYGQKFYVSGKVSDPSGVYGPYGGEAHLQILAPNSAAWTTIGVDASPGYLFFDADYKFAHNAQLRVVYTGYTAENERLDTFLPAETAPVKARVTRAVTLNSKRTTVFGKIAPKYKRKPVKVHKKVGKKWKKYRTFKTNKKSRFRFTLPAPRRGKWKWRITVPGNKTFTAWKTTGTTYRTRSVAPRVTLER